MLVTNSELPASVVRRFGTGEAVNVYEIVTSKIVAQLERGIASWLRALSNEPQWIVWAASRAQRAADHILQREATAEVAA